MVWVVNVAPTARSLGCVGVGWAYVRGRGGDGALCVVHGLLYEQARSFPILTVVFKAIAAVGKSSQVKIYSPGYIELEQCVTGPFCPIRGGGLQAVPQKRELRGLGVRVRAVAALFRFFFLSGCFCARPSFVFGYFFQPGSLFFGCSGAAVHGPGGISPPPIFIILVPLLGVQAWQ